MFYSKVDGDITTMTVQLIRIKNGEWVDGGTQTIIASGVDMVRFCDLDNNGVSEILVGWQVYGTSEMQLAVYSYNENVFAQRLLQKYTNFITCDLNGDQKSGVLIIDLNTTEQYNTAALYSLTDEGVVQTGICELDSKLQSIGEPIIAELSNGKEAVYLDAIKGVGAVTEVIVENKGSLTNPLFDTATREKFGMTLEQASACVSYMDSIRDSLIWLAFIDSGDGSIRVRLRSRFVTVSELAERYHGGGHACAAGATVYSVDEMKQLIKEADKLHKEYKANNTGWL